jgi:hypothetical protein
VAKIGVGECPTAAPSRASRDRHFVNMHAQLIVVLIVVVRPGATLTALVTRVVPQWR